MTQPGKHYRKGITQFDAVRFFADEKQVEKFFEAIRWPDGVRCPRCDGENVRENNGRKPMPYRCRTCRRDFSVRIGTAMQHTHLSYGQWGLAIFEHITNLKGVSSMKMHRNIGCTQSHAWHLLHRIREGWDDGNAPRFAGPVEADETYIGGKEKNKHSNRKLRAGRGTVGKVAVVGVKDRATKQVRAKVVQSTDTPTLQGFVEGATEPGAMVYTDEAAAYNHLDRPHEAVQHSVKEYVYGHAHTNGIESMWSMMKRGYQGVYHHWSAKHCQQYVDEYSGRQNQREQDTWTQLVGVIAGMVGKQLTYKALTA